MARLGTKTNHRPVPAIPFSQCCAKTTPENAPGLTVEEHCLIVSEVAHQLARTLPLSVLDSLPYSPALPALLHDVGKISPGFQIKYFKSHLRTLRPELAEYTTQQFRTDHAAIGAAAINRVLGERTKLSPLATIVALHHGAIRQKYISDYGEIFGGDAWMRQREKLIRQFTSEQNILGNEKLSAVQLSVLAGLLCIADWIGSDEDLFPPQGLPQDADVSAIASQAVQQCGLSPVALRPALAFDAVFPFKPNAFQSDVAATISEPGLYVIEAPMGMGKTEAALYAAYHLLANGKHNGIFFGLPTRLTSDRIHERVQHFLDAICANTQDAKLAHGMAWLKEFETGGAALRAGNAWFNPRKRRLLHPFVVGTIDQALLSILRVKHYFVRTYALAGKVVILDEVHSYDVYTSHLIDKMVRQLVEAGCTVMILSATLSADRRSAFFPAAERITAKADAYPLITGWCTNGDGGNTLSVATEPPNARTHRVSLDDWDDAAVARHASAQAIKGHCVLCIANTVARAQSWKAAVMAQRKDDAFPVGLLHSRFPAYRRQEVEDEWMKALGQGDKSRPNGCVLVATQVVEQSVDIDADTLITELAPTDMLLQRMGRQWRHTRPSRPSDLPEVTIVCGQPEPNGDADMIVDAFGKANCLVYAPYVLWKTWTLWQDRDKVVLPSDIRELIRLTYERNEEAEPTGVKALHADLQKVRTKLETHAMAALANIESMPVGDDSEQAATRYSDLPTTQVLLVKEIETTGRIAKLTLLDDDMVEANADIPNLYVTQRLHHHVLNLSTHWLRSMGIPQDKPTWLNKHFYETTVPLRWNVETGQLHTVDNQPTDLHYTAHAGVARKSKNDVNTKAIPFVDEYEDINVFDKQRFDW